MFEGKSCPTDVAARAPPGSASAATNAARAMRSGEVMRRSLLWIPAVVGGACRRRYSAVEPLVNVPAVPVDELVDRPTALGGTARALAPLGIGRGPPEGDSCDDRQVDGDREQLAPSRLVLELQAVDAGSEPFFDRRKEHEHHRGPGIDVPEGHRPHELLAARRVE